MVQGHYFLAQVFVLCLHSLEATSNTNVFIFEAEQKASDVATYNVLVNLTASPAVCDARFLGVAIGSKRLMGDFSSVKLQNLAAGLAPSDIRVGGTSADFLKFVPSSSESFQSDNQVQESSWDKLDSGQFRLGKDQVNYTISGNQWDKFVKFTTQVGYDILFDVNLFFWREDGLWDSSNAKLFLDYSASKGIRIPYLQLGNEPNGFWGNFGFRIYAPTLLADFRILKNLTANYPLYASSKIYGPDVSHAGAYFQDWVKAGAYDVVDEYSLHHYYLDGSLATASDFLSVTVLDSLKAMYNLARTVMAASPRPLPIRLTETASCFGGGTPGLSDKYIAGFMWLDKLGVSAQYGVTRVFRQTLVGASYALVTNSIEPTPDYYLSVLFKRLVEGPVFNISVSPSNPNLRVYAHCARKGLYSPGALVVYYLNLGSSDTVLALNQFPNADLDLYLLTPGDAAGLESDYVKLNGNVLLMPGDTLPPLPPKPYKGEVTVAAQSFGFIVVPSANVALCVKYYADNESKL